MYGSCKRMFGDQGSENDPTTVFGAGGIAVAESVGEGHDPFAQMIARTCLAEHFAKQPISEQVALIWTVVDE